MLVRGTGNYTIWLRNGTDMRNGSLMGKPMTLVEQVWGIWNFRFLCCWLFCEKELGIRICWNIQEGILLRVERRFVNANWRNIFETFKPNFIVDRLKIPMVNITLFISKHHKFAFVFQSYNLSCCYTNFHMIHLWLTDIVGNPKMLFHIRFTFSRACTWSQVDMVWLPRSIPNHPNK